MVVVAEDEVVDAKVLVENVGLEVTIGPAEAVKVGVAVTVTLPPDPIDDPTVTTWTLVCVMTNPPLSCCPEVAKAVRSTGERVTSFVGVAPVLPSPPNPPCPPRPVVPIKAESGWQRNLVSGGGRVEAVHVGGQSPGEVTRTLQDMAADVVLKMAARMLWTQARYDEAAVRLSMRVVGKMLY